MAKSNEFAAIVILTGIEGHYFKVPGAKGKSQPVVAIQYGKGTAAEHGGYFIMGPRGSDSDDVVVDKLLRSFGGDTMLHVPNPIMMFLQGQPVVPFNDEMVRGVDSRELFQFKEPTDEQVAQAAIEAGATVH